MRFDEIIGTIGVAVLLMAYGLNVYGMIKSRRLYAALNAVGAGLACYASWLIAYYPFVVLEGAWILVSIFSLCTAPATVVTPTHESH